MLAALAIVSSKSDVGRVNVKVTVSTTGSASSTDGAVVASAVTSSVVGALVGVLVVAIVGAIMVSSYSDSVGAISYSDPVGAISYSWAQSSRSVPAGQVPVSTSHDPSPSSSAGQHILHALGQLAWRSRTCKSDMAVWLQSYCPQLAQLSP